MQTTRSAACAIISLRACVLSPSLLLRTRTSTSSPQLPVRLLTLSFPVQFATSTVDAPATADGHQRGAVTVDAPATADGHQRGAQARSSSVAETYGETAESSRGDGGAGIGLLDGHPGTTAAVKAVSFASDVTTRGDGTATETSFARSNYFGVSTTTTSATARSQTIPARSNYFGVSTVSSSPGHALLDGAEHAHTSFTAASTTAAAAATPNEVAYPFDEQQPQQQRRTARTPGSAQRSTVLNDRRATLTPAALSSSSRLNTSYFNDVTAGDHRAPADSYSRFEAPSSSSLVRGADPVSSSSTLYGVGSSSNSTSGHVYFDGVAGSASTTPGRTFGVADNASSASDVWPHQQQQRPPATPSQKVLIATPMRGDSTSSSKTPSSSFNLYRHRAAPRPPRGCCARFFGYVLGW